MPWMSLREMLICSPTKFRVPALMLLKYSNDGKDDEYEVEVELEESLALPLSSSPEEMAHEEVRLPVQPVLVVVTVDDVFMPLLLEVDFRAEPNVNFRL